MSRTTRQPWELQRRVADAVGLERRTMGVEGVAVDLDDHARLRPVEVDLVAVDLVVDPRRRELVGADEREEGRLQLRTGGTAGVAGEDGVQAVPASRRPLQQRVKLVAAREAQDLGLGERAFQGPERDVVGEVEQGAGGGGGGDAVVASGVAGVEGSGLVRHDTAERGVPAQHMDRPAPGRAHTP